MLTIHKNLDSLIFIKEVNVTLQNQMIYTTLQNIEQNIYFINIVYLANNNISKLVIFFGLEKSFYLPKILRIFAANDDEDCFTPAPSICRPPT